ncbi:NAD(P)H-binding protein [Haloferax sp. KTX1]|uniref:NAD(P)H-binding protein n=1 Tax=Haloferax sp. KTX1 TaxID=2600597 RepID=UPI0011DDA370|nr:NAD(P)H-binding protein [Haloferax sp. KTX1]
MKVLVTGATGFVGRHLVPLLLDAGHDVVVFVRDAARYDGPPGAAVVEGDIFEPATLAPAMAGVDAAYYLIHSMHAGGDFEARDRLAARNFVDAAESAGVGRIVYLGGLGEDRDRLSAHLRSRREVEHILASGAPELTTLRAAIIVGAGSASFEMVRQLATRLPVMVTPQWVETRCQPVAIADVVAYLAGVLDHPETAGETYEIGGPDVLTYREMLQRVGAQLGHAPRIVPVPVLTPRLSSYWIGLVTDVDTGVARPLIEGLKNPVVVGDDRIRDIVAVDETPFDAAVERALREERELRGHAAEPASTTPT